VDLKSSADDIEVQEFGVVRRIPHPDYRAPQKYNDIALLQLDGDVYFDSFVSPACLHTQSTLPDETLMVSGWGRSEPGVLYSTSRCSEFRPYASRQGIKR
jgi:hypothetical protein